MILSTTNEIQGKNISNYIGIVTGISYTPISASANLSFKEMFSSKNYYKAFEKSLEEAKEIAFQKLKENGLLLKANAIVGISVDIEPVANSHVTMISIVGTAVTVV